ncbi:KOW domain-containing RNA-binding protein [Paenibacillus sp. GD4]|uniref:KOW domain-containing RNA-binding protein n=1 Tax=Paenibacillus sp. GD4 TaxID=3068890 RepID=UPI002796B833|nr:KOW domain-containing RNA-binding protein [Paenibacillus sp. GD4]MDQ1910854.1 KOW domain-containing RNA-binding protein [Paenibacillus sp. GD4]
MSTTQAPQIGQIVKVNRGIGSGMYAVIINVVDQRFVWIADGCKRKFDKPKKKNLLHLELLPVISSYVRESLLETGRVTNGKLRDLLMKYANNSQLEAQEKGE